MKKKGFTLMELLAVIVILAVLALITIPIVSNLIKNSKKEAFRISVGQVSDNIFFHYTKDWLIEGMDEDKVFDFETHQNLDLLTVSGSLPTSGSMSINPQGKISINVSNGVYCAVKGEDQDKIQVGDVVDGVCQLTGESIEEQCDIELGYTWEFDYKEENNHGVEQTFTPSCTGYYKLEVWGAQGGSSGTNYPGGYGGYSKGTVKLNKDENVFINVGGQGKYAGGNKLTAAGGYNGGGDGYTDAGSYTRYAGGGGGATHIALSSGLLTAFSPDLEESKHSNLLIVAGGGGGTWNTGSSSNWETRNPGHGGGFKGVTSSAVENGNYSYGLGGTQTSGNAFGKGENVPHPAGGAGGGYYGGQISSSFAAGGGSGYIGNEKLFKKAMYCYECEENSSYATKTISTTVSSDIPISRTPKKNNGYGKITYIGSSIDMSIQYEEGDSWIFDYKEVEGNGEEQVFTIPVNGIYKLEVWGAEGGSYSTYLGGTGGYSVGQLSLNKNTNLYINVGGSGMKITSSGGGLIAGGYNGGGYGYSGDSYNYVSSGGGATHIALDSGLLSTFENKQDKLLIVAGGGGSAFYHQSKYGNGGHAGGFIGGSGTTSTSAKVSTGGTQESGGKGRNDGSFGQGAYSGWGNGAGGGYFGGGSSVTGVPNEDYNYTGAGGGSGYIGNNLLTDKHMYCYNCQTSPSTNVDTYTISNGTNSCKNTNPIVDCAKQGNGYAKITLLEIK